MKLKQLAQLLLPEESSIHDWKEGYDADERGTIVGFKTVTNSNPRSSRKGGIYVAVDWDITKLIDVYSKDGDTLEFHKQQMIEAGIYVDDNNFPILFTSMVIYHEKSHWEDRLNSPIKSDKKYNENKKSSPEEQIITKEIEKLKKYMYAASYFLKYDKWWSNEDFSKDFKQKISEDMPLEQKKEEVLKLLKRAHKEYGILYRKYPDELKADKFALEKLKQNYEKIIALI